MTKSQVDTTANSVQKFPIVNGQEGKKVSDVLPKDLIRAIAHIWRFTEEAAVPAIAWGVGVAVVSEGCLQGSRAWRQIPTTDSYLDTMLEAAIVGCTSVAIWNFVRQKIFDLDSPYPIAGGILGAASGAVASAYVGGVIRLFRG